MENVTPATDWESRLSLLLPIFGHRNWIVVADSAYPAQSQAGIETIVSGEDQLHVVNKVLAAIDVCKHIRANVYVDKEIEFVDEKDAPGISEYRGQLEAALGGASAKQLPHEQIIAKLDQSAEVFRILIIKTEMTIPYTSVFFELDCGYWDARAEERLRQAIQAANQAATSN
jgi:L-fucose mutarotase/ribose pyranase (RbsD/FucU family)